jgi:hypothetical protein
MEYIFKKTDTSDTDIGAYAKLLSQVFGHSGKFSFDYLDWQYRLNPHGSVVGYDAYLGEDLAAHYATIPVLYEIHGEEVRGLLSLNTATHPNHQRKGLFPSLAKKTYEAGLNEGYRFVIGVANQNSSYGFLKKLNFSLIAPLDVKIGLGKIQEPRQTPPVRSLWDEASIRWRLSNPEAAYLSRSANIVCRASKYGVDAQLFSFQQSLDNSFPKSAAPFRMWVGISQENNAKGFFINLPDKLKPSPLNLIFRALDENLVTPKKEDVFFELIDFDAY